VKSGRRRRSGFEAVQSDENQGVKKPQPAQDHSQVVIGAEPVGIFVFKTIPSL
jgi:hypothetical protein